MKSFFSELLEYNRQMNRQIILAMILGIRDWSRSSLITWFGRDTNRHICPFQYFARRKTYYMHKIILPVTLIMLFCACGNNENASTSTEAVINKDSLLAHI